MTLFLSPVTPRSDKMQLSLFHDTVTHFQRLLRFPQLPSVIFIRSFGISKPHPSLQYQVIGFGNNFYNSYQTLHCPASPLRAKQELLLDIQDHTGSSEVLKALMERTLMEMTSCK